MPDDEPRRGRAEKERGAGDGIRLVQHDAVRAVPPQLERERRTERNGSRLAERRRPHDVDLAAPLAHGLRAIVGGDDLDVPVARRAVAEIAQHGLHAAARRRIQFRGMKTRVRTSSLTFEGPGPEACGRSRSASIVETEILRDRLIKPRVCDARGELRPRKAAGADAAGGLALSPSCRVSPALVEERAHGTDPGLRLTHGTVMNGRAPDFLNAGKITVMTGVPHAIASEQRQAKAFALRWLEHQRRATVHRRQRAFVEEADDGDAVGQAQVVNRPFLLNAEGPSNADEVQFRARAARAPQIASRASMRFRAIVLLTWSSSIAAPEPLRSTRPRLPDRRLAGGRRKLFPYSHGHNAHTPGEPGRNRSARREPPRCR